MSLTSSLIQLIRNKPISDDDLASAALFTLDAVACAYAGSNTSTGEKLIAWAKSPRKLSGAPMIACFERCLTGSRVVW